MYLRTLAICISFNIIVSVKAFVSNTTVANPSPLPTIGDDIFTSINASITPHHAVTEESFVTDDIEQKPTAFVANEEFSRSTSASKKIPLYIIGFFGFGGNWDNSGVLPAVELAIDHINDRLDILPEYEIRMLWNDTKVSNFQSIDKLPSNILCRSNVTIKGTK